MAHLFIVYVEKKSVDHSF